MIKYGIKYDDKDGRTYYVTKDYSVSTNPLDTASFDSRDELKEAAHRALVDNEFILNDNYFRTYWSTGRIRGFAFDDDGKINLNQSKKPIKSAVDGGWEVDSSDATKALNMWVDYVGEDNALEDLAQATGDDNLKEDIEWISRQFGVVEELEGFDSTWEKHEELRHLIGTHEYFENLWRAMGYDELAACMAFIFRMNNFQEWDDENGIYQSKGLKNRANVHKLYSSVSEAGYTAHEIMTFPEFQSYVRSIVEPIEVFENKAYFVIVETEAEANKLSRRLFNEFGVLSSTYSLQDPYNEFHGKWQIMC